MNLEVVVVTTKPDANQAEYGVRNTDTGEWAIHGVLIPVDLGALSPEQQATIAGARAIMTAAATAHAVAAGHIPAP